MPPLESGGAETLRIFLSETSSARKNRETVSVHLVDEYKRQGRVGLLSRIVSFQSREGRPSILCTTALKVNEYRP